MTLQDLVNQKDTVYQWDMNYCQSMEGYKVYLIELISQQWRNQLEVQDPIWRHQLRVVVPNQKKGDSALLMIAGGLRDTTRKIVPEVVDWALHCQSVAIELSLVPYQRQVFKEEEDLEYKVIGRLEDQLVAYTWKKFLETQDPTWPLQVAMTKSVIRAMDCIEEFSQKELGSCIHQFFVTGLSKRGWTSWLTAACDERVIGVAPVVIDILNLRASIAHHFDVYGKWAPAIADYEKLQIDQWLYTEEFSKLLDLIEPFHYREKLTMPKYIVNSAGDEFFVPDSSQFYFKELEGPKYLRYIPNQSHAVYRSEDALSAIGAFYQMVLEKKELPQFSWNQKKADEIEIYLKSNPLEVSLWHAHNPTARDFRLESIGAAWKKTPFDPAGNMQFEIPLQMPQKGWGAYFVELKFASLQVQPLIFTTDVIVLTREHSG